METFERPRLATSNRLTSFTAFVKMSLPGHRPSPHITLDHAATTFYQRSLKEHLQSLMADPNYCNRNMIERLGRRHRKSAAAG
jgi:hypothetical protein